MLDFPNLVHPAQGTLTGVFLDSDDFGYSTFYHLNRTLDTSGELESFYINHAIYRKLSDRKDTIMHVQYLPHTKHVINVSE